MTTLAAKKGELGLRLQEHAGKWLGVRAGGGKEVEKKRRRKGERKEKEQEGKRKRDRGGESAGEEEKYH